VSSKEFYSIFRNCKSLKVGDLLFRVGINNGSKIGFIVSKKYGNAIKRNLFKRRARSLFQKQSKIISSNIAIIVQPLKNNVDYLSLDASFKKVFQKYA